MAKLRNRSAEDESKANMRKTTRGVTVEAFFLEGKSLGALESGRFHHPGLD